MTKTETREIMTSEIISCIAKSLDKVPSQVKIDFKGTKNYITLSEYGVYVCFYVTSSLSYSIRIFDYKENSISLIEYDQTREKKELKTLVKSSFKGIIEKASKQKY